MMGTHVRILALSAARLGRNGGRGGGEGFKRYHCFCGTVAKSNRKLFRDSSMPACYRELQRYCNHGAFFKTRGCEMDVRSNVSMCHDVIRLVLSTDSMRVCYWISDGSHVRVRTRSFDSAKLGVGVVDDNRLG